jgi:hypothetical protein
VTVAVLEVTDLRHVFNYLTLAPDMIQDHLPDSYARAIATLRKDCLYRDPPSPPVPAAAEQDGAS